MSDMMALFDMEPEPERPIVITSVPYADHVAADDDYDGLVKVLTKQDRQKAAAAARNRIRRRHLVKVYCDAPSCAWQTKCPPAELPAACPGCASTGTITVIKWVSR